MLLSIISMRFISSDHVQKKDGMKFVGTVLASYYAPDSREPGQYEEWIVVLLDPNEASDSLQHLYPARLFEHAREQK